MSGPTNCSAISSSRSSLTSLTQNGSLAHELVAEILAAQFGMAALQPGHVLACLRYQTCIEHIPENDKTVPLVSPQRF